MTDLNQVRAALIEIDTAIHNLWDLGKNIVAGWTADEDGLQIALAPCPRVLAQAATMPELLHGSRRMDSRTFRRVCKVLQARVLRLPLPFRLDGDGADPAHSEAIDSVIRRYSIVRTEHRAMVLFENRDFTTATPVQQIAQFVSLEHSLAEAAEQMNQAGLGLELARSTAGDGALYVWNREVGLEGDLRTYAAMVLALVGNALAREAEGAESGIVPTLRTVFSIGSHLSYHQVEANRPRTFEYATGQVSITLARLAASALAHQILVGSFERPVDGTTEFLDAILFVARAEKLLAALAGRVIGDQTIGDLRSLIGSGSLGAAGRGIIRYTVEDKHGFRHDVFNLRLRAARAGVPLKLGLRTDELAGFAALPSLYELPVRSPTENAAAAAPAT